MVVAMGIFGMAGVAGLIVMSIGAANYVDLTALDPDTDFQLHSNACNIINVEVTTSQGTHQSGTQGSGTSSYCYKYYDITFSFQGQDWSDGDRTGCGASTPWTVGDNVDCWGGRRHSGSNLRRQQRLQYWRQCLRGFGGSRIGH